MFENTNLWWASVLHQIALDDEVTFGNRVRKDNNFKYKF
jgi:hypothetical protein